jgi:hypothetical protein
MTVKHNIRIIEFPQDDLDDSSIEIEERIPSLQEFLISILKIAAFNSFHPSKLFINLFLNEFLAVDLNWEKIQELISLSMRDSPNDKSNDEMSPSILETDESSQKDNSKPEKGSPKDAATDIPLRFHFSLSKDKKIEYNMVRVYLQNLFLLNSLESIVAAFVETFLSHKIEDIDETQWTVKKASAALKNLQSFMSRIHHFILQHFQKDFDEIIDFYRRENYLSYQKKPFQQEQEEQMTLMKKPFSPVASQPLQTVNRRMSTDSVVEHFQPQNQQEQQQRQQQQSSQSDEEKDRQEEIMYRHIRKQIESEIYMKCVDRVKYVVHRSLATTEEAYLKKIEMMSKLPLSFYDISETFLSWARWQLLIAKFQSIQFPALPTTKIEILVESCKYISFLYHDEHYHGRHRDPVQNEPEAGPQSPVSPLTSSASHSTLTPIKKTAPPSINSSENEKDLILGADVLLPCYVYAIAQAKIPSLIFINFELQSFIDPERNFSELGYCLATLEAVIQHILEVDLTQQKFVPSNSASPLEKHRKTKN